MERRWKLLKVILNFCNLVINWNITVCFSSLYFFEISFYGPNKIFSNILCEFSQWMYGCFWLFFVSKKLNWEINKNPLKKLCSNGDENNANIQRNANARFDTQNWGECQQRPARTFLLELFVCLCGQKNSKNKKNFIIILFAHLF